MSGVTARDGCGETVTSSEKITDSESNLSHSTAALEVTEFEILSLKATRE